MTAPKQHKQRYYYIFWSIATLCVVLGQVYVAVSYRGLTEALKFLENIVKENTPNANIGYKGESEELKEIFPKIIVNLKRSNCEYYHPGKSADIISNNNILGSFGELHPKLMKKFLILS